MKRPSPPSVPPVNEASAASAGFSVALDPPLNIAVRGIHSLFALPEAAKVGRTYDACRLVYAAKADARGNKPALNVLDGSGFSSLHWAAQNGDDKLIGELLGARANVNVKSMDEGATPLHVAAMGGEVSAINMLLSGAADVKAQDGLGRMPQQVAHSAGHQGVVGQLASAEDALSKIGIALARIRNSKGDKAAPKKYWA